MFAICGSHLSPLQKQVFRGYVKAFFRRGLQISAAPIMRSGPHIFGEGSPIVDKSPHCFWSNDDGVDVHPEAGSCSWVWHPGPALTVLETDPRVIILPRNDFFEIRHTVDNTPTAWAQYREAISLPWDRKRHELHFLGQCTGTANANNPRIRACVVLQASGLPVQVGLLPDQVPSHLVGLVPLRDPEPLAIMGQYRYVLSLWGNYPFNPRLYRGLEAGSLVFHQASQTTKQLDDGILIPGEHYVELKPDLSDMLEKIIYYMEHPAEAREIAEAGHDCWMRTLYIDEPYTIPDILWERFVSQPHWDECRADLDVHEWKEPREPY